MFGAASFGSHYCRLEVNTSLNFRCSSIDEWYEVAHFLCFVFNLTTYS